MPSHRNVRRITDYTRLFILTLFLFILFPLSTKSAYANPTAIVNPATGNAITTTFTLSATQLYPLSTFDVLFMRPDGTNITTTYGAFSTGPDQTSIDYNFTMPANSIGQVIARIYNHYRPIVDSNIFTVDDCVSTDQITCPSPPVPFLDLPWDYEGKSLSFNEAALRMTYFFDHEHPLLSSGLGEPFGRQNSVIYYLGGNRDFDRDYSSHDGYDYARLAEVNIDNPVLAAASGWATYDNSCSACGNAIHIDHGNGYQTRYYHLQEEDLITNTPGQKVWVSAGEKIGLVGATGNVSPSGNQGAHIHFMVVQDKNNDGNFEDNIPDGVTDPYGWQSQAFDPWPIYPFFYNGENRIGNTSYYLWKKRINNLNVILSSNGGMFPLGIYTLKFPDGSTNQDLFLNLQASPMVRISNNLISLGSTIIATATDSSGNSVQSFDKPFLLSIDFNSIDLTPYITDTISIYSTSDGISWNKELTNVDFTTKTASAKLNHMTHFALMAERRDTTAPTTTAALNGQEGEQSWYKSDVEVSLNAQDNTDGLGVDYTLYKKDEEDWQDYNTPLNITQEGHHKVSFYSVDKDGNIEAVKTIEFDIDKTPPEISIWTEPSIIWPPNGKNVSVRINGTIDELHLASKSFTVNDEYGNPVPVISDFGDTIFLEARRIDDDLDGRKYIIKVMAWDLAGNTSSAETKIIVPHDKNKK